MRRFPTGVAVVAVDAGAQELALTVGTLVSLSLEPPLVGFGIRRDAALHELLRESEMLAVSMLATGQEALAQHFARGVPPIALWTRIPLRDTGGPPQLDGAVAWLTGRLTQEHETGDHTFFVAEVESAEPGPAEQPLVFYRQSYAVL